MTEVIIRNKAMMEKLNTWKDKFLALGEHKKRDEYMLYSSPEALNDPEYYCDEEYLKYQMSIGKEHSGFPEEHMSMPINRMFKKNPEVLQEVRNEIKYDFATEIGAHTSALLNYYPPGGFVGWHTNWNANAYQVLFTWSETGDGYFRYWDLEKQEIVHIPDTKGWACRHYYFGHLNEPENHCWHSAFAGCSRITLAYKFINHVESAGNRSVVHNVNAEKDELARRMRDNLIEEVESEE